LSRPGTPPETSLVESLGHPRPRIPRLLAATASGWGAQHLEELRPDLEHRVEREAGSWGT